MPRPRSGAWAMARPLRRRDGKRLVRDLDPHRRRGLLQMGSLCGALLRGGPSHGPRLPSGSRERPYQRLVLVLEAALTLGHRVGSSFGRGLGRLAFPPKTTGAGLAGAERPEGPRPLVRRVQKLAPPSPGETARAWLLRLGRLRPDRAAPLTSLAEAVDRTLYGGAGEGALRTLVKSEARAWK